MATAASPLSGHAKQSDETTAVTAGNPPAAERNRVLEDLLAQILAEQPRLKLSSLTSLECGPRRCEIAYIGTESNTDPGGDYELALNRALWVEIPQRSQDFRFRRGTIRLRDLAPGTQEVVMLFAYQTLEDLSTDPAIAARQHAACAAVRRLDAENNADAGSAAGLRRVADEELATAASVLGREAAERYASGYDTDGPIFRGCRHSP